MRPQKRSWNAGSCHQIVERAAAGAAGRSRLARNSRCDLASVEDFARSDKGRSLNAALSTIAASKAGILIAAANPIIVSANSSMMALLEAIRGSLGLARTGSGTKNMFLPGGF